MTQYLTVQCKMIGPWQSIKDWFDLYQYVEFEKLTCIQPDEDIAEYSVTIKCNWTDYNQDVQILTTTADIECWIGFLHNRAAIKSYQRLMKMIPEQYKNQYDFNLLVDMSDLGEIKLSPIVQQELLSQVIIGADMHHLIKHFDHPTIEIESFCWVSDD